MKYKTYTKEWLETLCKESCSYREVLIKSGRVISGGNQTHLTKRIKEFEIDTSHFTGKLWSKGKTSENDPRIKSNSIYKIEDIFIENSNVARSVVRKYVIRHSLMNYSCELCGNIGEWFGNKISLELDHINGIPNDHRLENLRWLCPNCHAATPTYGSKNIKTVIKTVEVEKKTKPQINKPKVTPACNLCGKIVTKSKYELCRDCTILKSRRATRPSRDELKHLIRTIPFLTIGKQFGVSDKSIRKWCRAEGLPERSKDIKLYSDEQWADI